MALQIADLFSVKDKVVVVTGGSRGIGEMIAAGFLANGAKVYISSRKADVCDATAARLAEPRRRVRLDPRRPRRARRHRRASSRSCASTRRTSTCSSTTPACRGARRSTSSRRSGWDKVMDTNVKGVFFLTQRLLPLLEAAATAEDPARVINIGSIDGIQTPTFDTVSYGPSKAAVHALTRQLGRRAGAAQHPRERHRPGPVPDVDAQHRRRHRRRRRGHRLGRPRPDDGSRPHRHRRGHRRAWRSSSRPGPAPSPSARSSPATAASSWPDQRTRRPRTS